MSIGRGGFGQSCWPKPELRRAGQELFWNQQASTYESADMTNDNRAEIIEVIERFKAHPTMGRDIVTLGGAIGCRDPKMILKEVVCQKNGQICQPPGESLQVFFNDLASDQVKRAKEDILAQCQNCANVKMKFCAGPIHEVCGEIQSNGSRVLMLGLYGADGFFHANPLRYYPMAGFDEYVKNSAILGDHFWYDWLFLKDGQLVTELSSLELSVTDPGEVRLVIRKQLLQGYGAFTDYYGDVAEPKELVAIQVVSAKENQDGFFLSHWFSIGAIHRLLDKVFPWPDFLVDFTNLPKGALFEIRRGDEVPKGAVTVLNNVIGNILPEEQMLTLEAIKSIL